MNHSDGYQGDDQEGDGVSRRLTDEQIEQLLAGQTPAGASSLAGVAEFFDQLATSAVLEIPEALAAEHISKAMAEARSAPNSDVAEAPSTRPLGRLRRRIALSGIFSSLAAKLILGSAVALASTAGAAAAGILPDPIQSVAADAASILGIDLPDPGDDAVDDAPTVTPPDNDTSGDSQAEPSTLPLDDSADPTEESDETESDDEASEPGHEDTELNGPLAVLVGTHDWIGTACDGTTLSVTYDISEDGSIVISGTTSGAEISGTSHGYKITFTDTEVEIRLDLDGEDSKLRVRVDRSCPDDDDDDNNADGGDDNSGHDDEDDESGHDADDESDHDDDESDHDDDESDHDADDDE